MWEFEMRGIAGQDKANRGTLFSELPPLTERTMK
jgi:hypothetical protein